MRDVNSYRIGSGGADEFGQVMDVSAPFVEPAGVPQGLETDNFEQYREFVNTSQARVVQNATGPIVELLKAANDYARTKPDDISDMLNRIRLAKEMQELIPQIIEEAEEGRNSILAVLGIDTPKKPAIKKPSTRKKANNTVNIASV